MRPAKCDTCGGSGVADNSDSLDQHNPSGSYDRPPPRCVCEDCNGTGRDLLFGAEAPKGLRPQVRYSGEDR